jgi:hypothetical protein
VNALPPDASLSAPSAGEVAETAEQSAVVESAVEQVAPALAPSRAVSSDEGSTGVAAADEAAERLRALDEAPIDDHVEIYEDAHRRLQEGLADLDER